MDRMSKAVRGKNFEISQDEKERLLMKRQGVKI